MTDPSQPTQQQWAEIADRLDCLEMPVYLRCDGHLVRAALQRTGKNRLAIVVGVNGWHYKGAWMMAGWEAHEEPRRFWRPVRRQRISAKQLKLYERLYGKRECKKRGFYDPFVWPPPHWNRPRPFIAHLRKHNQRIEVIDYETYKTEVAAMIAAEEKPDV